MKEGREGTMDMKIIPGRRTSAKALRQECLWPVQGDQGGGSRGDELGEGMGK